MRGIRFISFLSKSRNRTGCSKVIALLLCSICCSSGLEAQVMNSAGATLADTMTFLNDKLEQRGTVQFVLRNGYDDRVSFEGFNGTGCEQTYRMVDEAGYQMIEKRTTLATIRLNQADATSVGILEPGDVITSFRVTVGKLSFSSQRTPHLQPFQELDLAKVDLLNGTVLTTDSTSFTFLPSSSGIPRRLSLDKSVTLYLGMYHNGDKRPKAKLADVVPGDRVQVFTALGDVNHRKTDVHIEKVQGASAPVLPDPEVMLPATREVGPERKEFVFGYSKSRDDVERMAKAMIHAIVLCQKDQKPSLF